MSEEISYFLWVIAFFVLKYVLFPIFIILGILMVMIAWVFGQNLGLWLAGYL